MFAINNLNTNFDATAGLLGNMNQLSNMTRSVTGNESQAQLRSIQQNEKNSMSAKIRNEITMLASGYQLDTNKELEKKKIEREYKLFYNA